MLAAKDIAENAQVEAIRLTMLGIVDHCISFTEGVEAGDIDWTCDMMVNDQLQYLHDRRRELLRQRDTKQP